MGRRILLFLAIVMLFSGVGYAQNQPAGKGPAKDSAVPPGYILPEMSKKVKTAIEKSFQSEQFAAKTKEVIKPGERPGYLGIPGGPSPSLILGFLWAVWVGWIFSTVGAFGGIMAGVGHISIFGLGNYASSFGKDHPLNKLTTDSIRVGNQWLVGLSAIISSFNYYKMGRLVLPLGICLAIGSVVGAWLIPDLTAGKINLKAYVGYFGIIVLAVGFVLLRETLPSGQAKKKKAKEAAAAFEKQVKEGAKTSEGVKVVEGRWGLMLLAAAAVVASALWNSLVPWGKWVAYVLALGGLGLSFFLGKTRFSFYGVEFEYQSYLPVLGGLVISAISAFIGVGGGFLYVPYLTSVAGLPMHIVAGTSALAVLVSMISSIFAYMVGKGVVAQWSFIGAELLGIFVGSLIGPRTSKYISDIWLKRIFIVLAAYVGIGYILRGFAGIRIPGI
jgi:uncharacterized membrane protein YfcA